MDYLGHDNPPIPLIWDLSLYYDITPALAREALVERNEVRGIFPIPTLPLDGAYVRHAVVR